MRDTLVSAEVVDLVVGHSSRGQRLSDSAKIVIIGGGVIGLSIAYHLAKLGERDVLLVERNQLTSGTSWHAAGIVGPLRASANLTRLAHYATELFREIETETGQATGYRQTGGFWLAGNEARLVELRRIADLGEMAGIEARIVGPEAVAERLPQLRVEDLAGALWVAEDGQANPVDVAMAYAKGARAGGVRIREGLACSGFEVRDGGVRAVHFANGERVTCQAVINCGGVWARHLGAMAGVAVPVQAVEHMYIVTEPIPELPNPLPIIRDLDAGLYMKGDAGRLVLGGFEHNAKPWDPLGPQGDQSFLELPEDWEQFEPFMTAGLHRLPLLERVGVQHFMNGPEGFTPDTKQVMGESPFLRGYYVAAGFNSIGMMSSAGAGKAMAEWVVAGEPPMDLWEVDIARFDPAAANLSFLRERVQESVSDQLAMHWPFKQKVTGRGLRRSPWHRELAEAGAVFGAPAGWERPLWFARDAGEESLRYSYGEQCWWPAAAREAAATRDAAALYDLSPFSKFDIAGADALLLLNRLCTSETGVDIERSVYTQMLNENAGIEADLTVMRRGDQAFRVVGAAATRWKDVARIRRLRDDWGLAAEVVDATSAEAVLGIMGPRSRSLLQKLSEADFSARAFPFGCSREIDLAMARVWATRVSFVGELGWELYIPVEYAGHLYEAVAEAGRAEGVTHAGLFCLDACRLEKGFRHWGHDIGPENTPLEAGLAFTVAWDKPGGFIGREALLRQREKGLARRLLLFSVEGGEPLLLHDEPIYRDGRWVGRTTSGGRGFRTGLSLCFGYVETEPSADRSAVFEGHYEIKVAGERYRLRPLRRPPYDPDGIQMRG